MRKRNIVFGVLALLAACGGGGSSTPADAHTSPVAVVIPVDQWDIGPVINGSNFSSGYTVVTGNGEFSFKFPTAGGSVNYVTQSSPVLSDKTLLRLTYTITADPGVTLQSPNCPGSPATLTLYFQRQGDNWSGAGAFESYRWYAKFSQKIPLLPGTYVVEAPLSGNWTAISTSSSSNNPAAFAAARSTPDVVGFVLGGCTGLGHGVFATGAATFTVNKFEIL
jgi:hypothetical protein